MCMQFKLAHHVHVNGQQLKVASSKTSAHLINISIALTVFLDDILKDDKNFPAVFGPDTAIRWFFRKYHPCRPLHNPKYNHIAVLAQSML